jgi:hypothetical protein
VGTQARLVAAVGRIQDRQQAIHLLGMPGTSQVAMPFPDVVLIQPRSDKPTAQECFLFRYTRDGQDCGDTWHQSVDDAKEQAVIEYGTALGAWVPVPDDEPDVRGYAIKFAGTKYPSG